MVFAEYNFENWKIDVLLIVAEEEKEKIDVIVAKEEKIAVIVAKEGEEEGMHNSHANWLNVVVMQKSFPANSAAFDYSKMDFVGKIDADKMVAVDMVESAVGCNYAVVDTGLYFDLDEMSPRSQNPHLVLYVFFVSLA